MRRKIWTKAYTSYIGNVGEYVRSRVWWNKVDNVPSARSIHFCSRQTSTDNSPVVLHGIQQRHIRRDILSIGIVSEWYNGPPIPSTDQDKRIPLRQSFSSCYVRKDWRRKFATFSSVARARRCRSRCVALWKKGGQIE
jgi:hypothetical protein